MKKEVQAEKARQGRWGMHVLLVLVCALILAGIAWFAVEIYGEYLAREPAAIHVGKG